MKAIIIFILFLFVSVSVFAQTRETDIMMGLLNLKTGLLNKDSVLLSSVLADDVTYGHTNGVVETKSQLIRSVMSGSQDYQIIDPSDIKMRFFDNTAVVNMKAHIKLNYAGTMLDLNMNILLVWIKKVKDWKLVARQSVSIK